jgi:hypothetical protein
MGLITVNRRLFGAGQNGKLCGRAYRLRSWGFYAAQVFLPRVSTGWRTCIVIINLSSV